MAKKRRRVKSTGFFSIPFLSGILVVLFVFAGVTFSLSNNEAVKSAKDFRPQAAKKLMESSSSGKLKACLANSRITSFTLEGACENKLRDAFTKASYTCLGGTTGVIENGCRGGADLLARAKLACAKIACPKPSPVK